jgi:7,8-dihydroneopterin aldolase/epimerase/oxygenase
MEPDCIRLTGLAIATHIGVPVEERALPQHLRVNLLLLPRSPLTGLGDDLAGTIDYGAVALAARTLAANTPDTARRLIETLAEEIADHLLAHFPLRGVTVEVVKFILPDTASVSAQVSKHA